MCVCGVSACMWVRVCAGRSYVPRCHLPIMPVVYPSALRASARVSSEDGRPVLVQGKKTRVSPGELNNPDLTGYRPIQSIPGKLLVFRMVIIVS